MQNDFIERYIYAVTKRMPRKLREDVGKELSGIIQDMLEERCAGIPPTEHDVRVVLAELGQPGELAEKYAPASGPGHLIGGDYYRAYVQLLKIILPCVLFGMAVSFFILLLLGGHEKPAGLAALQWLGSTFAACGMVFACFTALFAIFERRHVKLDMGKEDLLNLPPVPGKHERISRGETIFGMALDVLFCIIFLAAPQILGWYSAGTGWQPLFTPALLQSKWWLILLFTAVGLFKQLIQLLDGRYTRRVALTTLFAGICTAVLAALLFADSAILNPAFLSVLGEAVGGNEIVLALFRNFNKLFLGIILFAVALDTGTALYRAYRAEKEHA